MHYIHNTTLACIHADFTYMHYIHIYIHTCIHTYICTYILRTTCIHTFRCKYMHRHTQALHIDTYMHTWPTYVHT